MRSSSTGTRRRTRHRTILNPERRAPDKESMRPMPIWPGSKANTVPSPRQRRTAPAEHGDFKITHGKLSKQLRPARARVAHLFEQPRDVPSASMWA
jgi:hypothetical protein